LTPVNPVDAARVQHDGLQAGCQHAEECTMDRRVWPARRAAVLALLLSGCGGGGADDLIPPFVLQGGVVTVDLDGDGRTDVAVASTSIAGPPPHPGFVDVYLQTAAGVFQPAARYAIGVDPWRLAPGDIDADGLLDLVASTPSSVPPQPSTVTDSGGVSILRQDPANPGRFLASLWQPTGGAAESAAVAELSGDGVRDLVVADGVSANGRALLFAQNPAQPLTFLSPVTLSLGVGRAALDVVTADIDADGLSDVVVAAQDSAAVFYRNPLGGFDPVVLLPAGLRPQSVAVSDIDGNGRLDLITANAGNAPAGGTGGAGVTVLLQTAPGVFTRSDVAVADGARAVSVADLNDDTVPDLAVISIVTQSQQAPRVTVLRQSPTLRGQFSLGASLSAPFDASFIATADVDADGLNDIIVNDGPSVFVQQASAPGTFAPYRPLR
jgi:hypothetical protein